MRLEATLEPRRNSRPICSVCGERGLGYDTLPMRHFEFVPFFHNP